jgi:hypothetical protein
MPKRSLRVAYSYLNQRVAQTEQPSSEPQIFDDNNLKKITQEVVEESFRRDFLNYLDGDLNYILKMMYFIVQQFNNSDFPKKKLDSLNQSLKNRLIKNIEEVGLQEKDSISETVYDNFKLNPTNSQEDIEEYTKNFYREILKNIKNKENKWKD